jgi:hypothetical protein
MVPSFGHKGEEICALLGYYAARSDNSLPNFWGDPLIDFLTIKVETDEFS